MYGDVTITIKADVLDKTADMVLAIIDKSLSENDVLPDKESVKSGIERWVQSFADEMVNYVDQYGFGPNSSRYGDLEEAIKFYESKNEKA